MEKTKLGISVSLAAALLYFLGLINMVALIVAVGYVLIAEKDQWLRKAAVQSLAITLGYQIISSVLGVGNRLFGFINDIIQNFVYSFHIGYPLNIDSILLGLAGLLQAVLLLVLGFMALAHKDFNLPLVRGFRRQASRPSSAGEGGPSAASGGLSPGAGLSLRGESASLRPAGLSRPAGSRLSPAALCGSPGAAARLCGRPARSAAAAAPLRRRTGFPDASLPLTRRPPLAAERPSSPSVNTAVNRRRTIYVRRLFFCFRQSFQKTTKFSQSTGEPDRLTFASGYAILRMYLFF